MDLLGYAGGLVLASVLGVSGPRCIEGGGRIEGQRIIEVCTAEPQQLKGPRKVRSASVGEAELVYMLLEGPEAPLERWNRASGISGSAGRMSSWHEHVGRSRPSTRSRLRTG